MATGLLRCPVCSASMHAKYSSASHKNNLTVVKYACSNKPNCTSQRLLVSETNDLLWNALVELFIQPERIRTLLAPVIEDDVDSIKKQIAGIKKDETFAAEKVDRLLNLYLEGNIPQASYVVKSSELQAETERLAQSKKDLQRSIQNHGKQDITAELIQTIRLLSRSHRRFTEEQKVKVFRSLIKETRITASGVELEMYVQPTQNVWWKYRQKSMRRNTVQLQIKMVQHPDVPGGHRTERRAIVRQN